MLQRTNRWKLISTFIFSFFLVCSVISPKLFQTSSRHETQVAILSFERFYFWKCLYPSIHYQTSHFYNNFQWRHNNSAWIVRFQRPWKGGYIFIDHTKNFFAYMQQHIEVKKKSKKWDGCLIFYKHLSHLKNIRFPSEKFNKAPWHLLFQLKKDTDLWQKIHNNACNLWQKRGI